MNKFQKLTIILAILSVCLSCDKQDSASINYFDFNTSNYYFRGELNEKLTFLEERLSSMTQSSGSLFSADSLDSININYSCKIINDTKVNGNRSSLEVIICKKLHHSSFNPFEVIPDSVFRNSLFIGTREFIIDKYNYHDKASGVIINWKDNQGTYWSTANYPTNLTSNKNRTFNITHSISQGTHPQLNLDIHKIRAVFDCTLYSSDGDSIRISHGEFVGQYSN